MLKNGIFSSQNDPFIPTNVRHPTSKLLKLDLVQTLNTFRNPPLPGRHLLFTHKVV